MTTDYKELWRDSVARNDALEQQIGRVMDIHKPDHESRYNTPTCRHCSGDDGDVQYPCPTIRALDGEN